jgi:hypothetical protein
MANALGACARKNHEGKPDCMGDLYVSGNLVLCYTCGSQQPEHEMQRAMQAPPLPPPLPIIITAQENAATIFDRVNLLEKKVAALEAKLARPDEPRSKKH